MGTPGRASAPRTLALVLIASAVAAACGGSGTTATRSPASSTRLASPSTIPSQSPSPVPVSSDYGVLVSALSSSSYTVSLVGPDGRVVASQQANTPGTVTCANAAAAIVPPPVSTSNTRVYFMDALGVVRYLAPNGDTGPVITLPIGPARRSLFSVSPDDALMSVAVVDFTAAGASTKLYLYQLQPGGTQVLTFSETGAYTLWPIGWHGTTSLVVAKVPSCTQGGGPFCCGPQELHVIDPRTAFRRFTIGSPTCVIVGPPSPAGAICEDTTAYAQANVVNWTGVTTHAYPIAGPTPAYIAPSSGGGVEGLTEMAFITNGSDTTIAATSRTFAGMQVCGWIDDTHVLSGGDAQHQPRVGDLTSGSVVPVAAQGDCAGRIPGGL